MSRIDPTNKTPGAHFKQQKEVPRELVYLSEQVDDTAGDAFQPMGAFFPKTPKTLGEIGHSATGRLSKTASKLLPQIDSASSSAFEAVSETFAAWFKR